jgi:hypothetical protein
MLKLRFMKKVLFVFCLFLVGTVLVVYLMNQPKKPSSETPAQVVEKYIHALKVNDLPTARSCWSFKESSSAMSALIPNLNSLALSIIIQVEQTMSARSDYKVVGQKKEGNAVIVQVERTFIPDKKTITFTARMILVNGKWKISKWGG